MSATETATSLPSPKPNPTKDGETLDAEDESYASCFQCCVCLDLLYKPIVLACGHISCFWCVHKAMHGLRASHCSLCRQPYVHFPGICQLLHLLLLKMEPMAYKRRESEVLEEEKRLDIFSPQFGNSVIAEDNSSAPEEIQRSTEDLKASKNVTVKEPSFPESGLDNGKHKQVSVDDVLCEMCKEMLFQPSVLNCGHVFCETCLCGLANGPLKCPVCESLHPGEVPNICLDLDHFLEEQFPIEYAMRKARAQVSRAEWRHGESSSSWGLIRTCSLNLSILLEILLNVYSNRSLKRTLMRFCGLHKKQSGEPHYSKGDHLLMEDDLRNVHVGVGCDSCGMYPLMGKRYRCKDCKEAIGFDLCEACYNSSSKLPGRFNQQHTPDHEFEIDKSQILCRILFRSFMDDPHQDLPVVYLPVDDLPEDNDDLENNDHAYNNNATE